MKTRILLFCLTMLVACLPEPYYCGRGGDLLAPEGFTIQKLNSLAIKGNLERIQFVNKDVGYILVGGLPAFPHTQILKTIDGGYSWDNRWIFGNTGSFRDMLFLDENIGIITDYTSDYPVIKRTEDGGISWSDHKYPELGEGRITRLHADADQNLYASLASTWVVKSTDKGKTWQVLPFARKKILALYQDRLYLQISYDEMMVTDLNGNHIKNILLPSGIGGSGLKDFEVIDEDNIIATDNCRTVQTSDGGDTWRGLFRNIMTYCQARVVGFNSPQEGIMIYEKDYCGDLAVPDATIGFTTDGGDSWKESEYFLNVFSSLIITEKINEDKFLIFLRDGVLGDFVNYELWSLER